MLESIDKKKVLIIVVIGIILICGGVIYFFVGNNNEEGYINVDEEFQNSIENEIKNEIVEEVKQIVVHVSGQVANKGVISLNEGSRLIDAINAAGGTTENADLSKVNLAYVLEDALKIYIPSVNDKDNCEYITKNSGDTEIITSGSGNNTNKKEENTMININTANEDELEKLQGIGSSIASRIVAYRKENGKFSSIEDIKNVTGIGENKFNNIKNNICVK